LAPLLASLIVVDIDALARYIAAAGQGSGYQLAGYGVHVVLMFTLGGLWAWLHHTEKDPRKLFQLGLVAPAMITAMMNGANVQVGKDGDAAAAASFAIVSTAHAQTVQPPTPTPPSPVDQFIKGLLKR
jgi:hypothetical protein